MNGVSNIILWNPIFNGVDERVWAHHAAAAERQLPLASSEKRLASHPGNQEKGTLRDESTLVWAVETSLGSDCVQ